jgi:hypothetical protein
MPELNEEKENQGRLPLQCYLSRIGQKQQLFMTTTAQDQNRRAHESSCVHVAQG